MLNWRQHMSGGKQPRAHTPEIIMHIVRNASIVLALGLAFSGAMAGEIADLDMVSNGAVNHSVGFLATARQNIGVAPIDNTAIAATGAKGNGKVTDSTAVATGASKVAAGFLSTAHQQIGGAQNDSKLSNSMIVATGSVNNAGGFLSTAEQNIGVVK
jgi:hypothetical protein